MGLWNWLKSLFGGGNKDQHDKPLLSLVLLLRQERFLDDHILRKLVSRSWDVEFDEHDPEATDFVVGASPAFFIQFQGRNFLVNNFPMPYVNDPGAVAKEIKELRRRQAILDHRAWLSVDLLGECTDTRELTQVYGLIGKLIATLADTDCLALFSPATSQLVPYDASLEEKLRGPEALGVFSELVNVPVVEVSADDPRMQAAVAEARQRWPEFTSAFAKRNPEQNFAVKVPFEDGDHTEFMWVTVTSIDGDVISGRVDNDPVNVHTVRCGSRVRVSPGKLNDWIYTSGDAMQGGFTIKAIEKIHGQGS